MKLKNTLTFGSNFGYQSHLKSIIKLKKTASNFIYSPNAHKKNNLNKKFLLNRKQIRNRKFDLISIATPPLIQNQICKSNIKNSKHFFLEKPLTENYIKTRKLFKLLKKNKINYYFNFIFTKIKTFQIFKSIIKKKKIIKGVYTWKFRQGYFINHRVNWKIINSKGGGLVNFYLIHVFYNLLFLIGEFKIQKVIFKKEKILRKLSVHLKTKKRFNIIINMDIDSNSSAHKIIFWDKKNKYEIKNNSKNWVKYFRIIKNNNVLKIKENNFDRDHLTFLNLKSLITRRKNKKELKFFELAHYYCNETNKKINIK